jgi:hypothetical protein
LAAVTAIFAAGVVTALALSAEMGWLTSWEKVLVPPKTRRV